jgi:ABC-type transporter Mla subunit MlaD
MSGSRSLTGPFRRAWRQFLDPHPASARPHHVRNGLIVLVVLGLASYAAIIDNVPFVGGVSGAPVRAAFAFANDVNNTTPVRVDGVNVGTVQKVYAGSDPRRTSIVLMRITNGKVKVHSDASAAIRWRTVLGGNVYIDLDPGSPSAPPLGNGVIPKSRTSSQVEIDQVLQPLAGGTAQDLRYTIAGLQQGFSDPQGTDQTIDTLPALDTVARGMQPLRGLEDGDLQRLVSSTAHTVAALGHTSQLQALVDGAQRTVQATDDRRQQLGELIDLSPPTLDQIQTTMAQLRTTLGHLDPLVSKLQPGARKLAPAADAASPALDQLQALLAEAVPLLNDARPTFLDLGQASIAGVPLMRGLNPTLRRLEANTIPWLDQTDSDTKLRTYEEIGPWFSSTDQGEFDAYGYRLRLSTPAGNNSLLTLASSSMASACRRDAPRSRDKADCGPLAKALEFGWFGRPTR